MNVKGEWMDGWRRVQYKLDQIYVLEFVENVCIEA